jgi:hypothetical protein
VNGGYDVNLRQMAANGVRVLGRILGARDGRLMVARSPNDVLDEAELYFLGLHWMHTFKSGLLSGVGRDAEYLAEHLASKCQGGAHASLGR